MCSGFCLKFLLVTGTIQRSAPDRGARAGCSCCARRILAPVHCAFSTWRIFASGVQPFCPLRSRSATRALHRHTAVCGVLLDFRGRLQRGRSCCIMGVVGAWAGFLLRYRHAPLAKQRLANIALFVASKSRSIFRRHRSVWLRTRAGWSPDSFSG